LTVVAAGAAVVVSGFVIASLLIPNLFGTTIRERPNSVVLAQLSELAQFQAATGRFQTIVDVEEDANLLPDWLKGEHKVLAAEGDVAAAVDFGALGEDALEISEDGTAVVVHVPPPALQPTHLDRSATRVISRDRGLLDRADDALTSGNPSSDDELYARAEEKLAEAAGQSDLTRRAEESTRDTLTDLLRAAGFETVTVVFDGAPRDPAHAA
jgi:hypothetical protein